VKGSHLQQALKRLATLSMQHKQRILPSRQVISYLLQQLHLMVKKQQRGTAASFITSYNNTTLRNGEKGGSKAITKVDETMTTNACLKAIPLVIYNTSISSTNKKSLGPLPRQKMESDFATENLPDISALRIESLEDGHSERIIGTSQPSNVDIDRLPRLSVEQSLPIQDILFHMAGDSPQPFCRINTDVKRQSDSKFHCHQPEEIPSFESILNHEIAQEEKATTLKTFTQAFWSVLICIVGNKCYVRSWNVERSKIVFFKSFYISMSKV
jgi:hypothetical protein